MKKLLLTLLLLPGLSFATLILDAPSTTVVQNTFSPTVTNVFSPTLITTNVIGATTVINTNIFSTSVSNNVTVAGVTVTNTTSFSGNFTFITNLNFNAQGLNVVTPTTESTNVSGAWTITIGTNSAAMLYTQTGAITSIVTALGSNVTTNDVALAFVGLRGNGSSVTWPTSQWVWASGAAPTVTSNQWNMYYIQLWRGDRHVATVGDTP